MASANIKEVARYAGVSLGTVSNVLNRPDVVSPTTRRRVLDAIDKLGYVRNDSARQLRAGRSRTIAIVVLDVSNPFFTDVIRGAEAVVESAGGMLVVCNSGEDARREHRYLDMLEEQRVQGLLITPVSDGRHKRLDAFVAHGIPVVLVDRGSGHPSRCSVAVDDVAGGRLAAEHLADRGHERIRYVGGPLSIRQVADRRAGATAALADSISRRLRVRSRPPGAPHRPDRHRRAPQAVDERWVDHRRPGCCYRSSKSVVEATWNCCFPSFW